MSIAAAVKFVGDQAIVVTGGLSDRGNLELLGVESHPANSLFPSEDSEIGVPEISGQNADDPEATSRESSNGESSNGGLSSDDGFNDVRDSSVEHTRFVLNRDEIDSTFGVLPANLVIHKNLVLPFKEQKKIEQVAPLQLQDALPFGTEDFVIDNKVLGESKRGGYEVLTSLAKEEDILRCLDSFSQLQLQPRVLTSEASAAAALCCLVPDYQESSYAIVQLEESDCNIAVFVQGKLVLLRSICRGLRSICRGTSGSRVSALDSREVLYGIKSTIAAAMQNHESQLEAIYLVTADESYFLSLEKQLALPVKPLDLSSVTYQPEPQNKAAVAELAWSIGLLRSQLTGDKEALSSLVDFRKGPLAYQPAWGSFWLAVKDELLYIILAIVFGAAWVASTIHRSNVELNKIEDKIRQVVAAAVPGETVPPRREVTFLEDRVVEIEEQLRGIGSLSSLSPLDSLKELSTAIPQDIDIDIASLSISSSRLTFRGSVPDNPAVGRLSGVLQKAKERFCDVNVTPAGRETRSSRVKFSAEITICE